MKILISTQGNNGLEDTVSFVFARAPYFTIVEVESGNIKNVEVIENQFASGFSGVGVQASQFAIDKGVDVVMTGNVGPNAMMVLQQAGIKVLTGYGGVRVKEALKRFLGGSGSVKGAEDIQAKSQGTFTTLQAPAFGFELQEITKEDLEFQRKMLELQAKMIEEQIKYIKRKIKEFEEKQ